MKIIKLLKNNYEQYFLLCNMKIPYTYFPIEK